VIATNRSQLGIMTLPLILQIQEAALDGASSITDALRKAKVSCLKLGISNSDFGKWIDRELNGYTTLEDLPDYRKLSGQPEGYNPYHGWQPVIFHSSQQKDNWSYAPIGMTISAIEDSIRRPQSTGTFSFPYPQEVEQDLRDSVNHGTQFRIALDRAHCGNIVHSVRNILLEWTVEMEKKGVLGENLMFSADEMGKSASVAAQTVNHINIGQVGSFVQHAAQSVVQGSVEATTTTLSQSTLDLVQQVEALLPASNLSAPIQGETLAALGELKEAASAQHPESGRLRKGLESLKRVLAPAGETLLKMAVDTAVTKLLQH
jgi:hypothetical protein